MAVRLQAPAGMTEVPARRGSHAKVFRADANPNQFRVISAVRRLHWNDAGTLRDIDVELGTDAQGIYHVRSAAYEIDFDPVLCRLRYRSRVTGDFRLQLVSVNGVPLTGITATPELRPDGEALRLTDAVLGLDLILVCRAHDVELFRRIKAGMALPCVMVWNADVTDGSPIQSNIEDLRGLDNEGRLDAAREAETLVRNRRRFVEITTVKTNEIVLNGRRSYTITETLTGRTRWLDPVTRTPEWRDEIVLPVYLDVTVTEEIAANADDGYANPAGAAADIWRTNTFDGFSPSYSPAWRFQTVAVPNGATINSATLQLNVNNAGTHTANLHGEAIDTAAAWAATSSNGPNRMTRTTASTVLDGGATGSKTEDVKAIIQEIVNRAGWASGNDMRLGAVDNDDAGTTVYFQTLDNAQDNATLTIDYTAGATVTEFHPDCYPVRPRHWTY